MVNSRKGQHVIRTMKLALLGIAGALAFSAFGATPVSAGTEASAQVDGCVSTSVTRSGQWVTTVTVRNVCDFTLTVDAHAFNGPAGYDRRSPRVPVGAGKSINFHSTLDPWYAPPGSWTCGELWGGNAFLWGRDCVQM